MKIFSLHFCNAVLACHFAIVYKFCVINTVVFLILVTLKPCSVQMGQLNEIGSSGL